MKKGIYNIIGSVLLISVMFFIVTQFQKLGNLFYQTRLAEAEQISTLVQENYAGITTLSNKEKDNIIQLYSDQELVGVDTRVQTGIMVSATYAILGLMALYYFILGLYQLYKHNKLSKGTLKNSVPS